MTLFLDQKSTQLFLGLTTLIAGIGVMPFMAGLLVSMSTRINVWLLGSLYDWQETTLAVSKIIFATWCVILAAYGAILLALTATVSAGLVKNPWE